MDRHWGQDSVCGSETLCVVLESCCGKRGCARWAGGHLASLMWLLPFILQFKYGVLEGRLFSGFYKEGRTNGQRGGRFSSFPNPFSIPWSFQESTLMGMEVGPNLRSCVFVPGASWSSWQKLAAVRASLIPFFEDTWTVELSFCCLS